MKPPKPLTLSFKEGSLENYTKALFDHFGGEFKADHYYYEKGKTRIHAAIHYIADGKFITDPSPLSSRKRPLTT